MNHRRSYDLDQRSLPKNTSIIIYLGSNRFVKCHIYSPSTRLSIILSLENLGASSESVCRLVGRLVGLLVARLVYSSSYVSEEEELVYIASAKVQKNNPTHKYNIEEGMRSNAIRVKSYMCIHNREKHM